MFQRVGQILLVVSMASGMSAQMVYSSKPAPITQQGTGETAPARTEPRKVGNTNAPQKVVVVPLNNTGIADWSFLNPRRPRGVPDKTDIEFDNQTSDRTFKVSTDLSIDVATLRKTSSIPALITEAAYLLENPNWSLDTARDAYEGTIRVPPSPPPKALTDRYTAAIEEVKKVDALQQIRTEVQKRFETAATEPAIDLDAVNGLKDKTSDQLQGNLKALGATQTQDSKVPGDALTKINAELDRLMPPDGTLSDARTKFIADIDARLKALGKHARNVNEVALRHTLQFAKEILTKQNTPNEVTVAAAQILFSPLRMDDCKVQATAIACTAVVTIQPHGTGVFPYAVLTSQADPDGPAKFTVAFFDETDSPANSTAYLISESKPGKPGAPKSVGTITAVAGINAADDPFIPKTDVTKPANAGKCPFACPGDQVYRSDHLLHFGGSGRIDVKQTFGNLLDGKVTLQYKGGDLGNPDDKGTVTLKQYQFNIYADTGLTLRYGKFDFAKPANEIAVSESGEGFRLDYRSMGAAYLVRKKNATDSVNHHSSDVFILQGNNLPVSSEFVRSVDVIGVFGRDRTPDTPEDTTKTPPTPATFLAHSYRTIGANLVYAYPSANVSGTLAGYDSTRHADQRDGIVCGDPNRACDGSGRVGLLTLTRAFSIDENNKATRTITGSLGLGTADSGTTPGKDESYIGEHAAFSAQDHLFFSTLRDKVQDGSTPRAGLAPSLAGKRYIGLQYVDNTFSLLEVFAGFLRISGDEIKSKSMIVNLGDYRARQDFNGSRPLGRELDVDFQVESPKGVTVSLGFGYFIPGSALRNILVRKVWSISGGINIKI
jgi:hypothetical protein